jgi:hypothetical protein
MAQKIFTQRRNGMESADKKNEILSGMCPSCQFHMMVLKRIDSIRQGRGYGPKNITPNTIPKIEWLKVNENLNRFSTIHQYFLVAFIIKAEEHPTKDNIKLVKESFHFSYKLYLDLIK